MNKRLLADIREIIEDISLIMPFARKRVLITGATGLIGSVLAKSLITASKAYNFNIEVICHVRNLDKAQSLFKEELEIKGFSLVDTPLEKLDVACDYIVHAASPTKSKYFIENPVDTIYTSIHGTERMLELSKQNKITNMVYLSSMEQYGIPYESGQVMTEDKIGYLDHLNVRSSYSESKRLCECYCKSYNVQYGVNVCIARLAQTFGAGIPLEDNRVSMQFAKSAIKGEPIVLHTTGDSISNFCYISDAVKAILVLLDQGVSGEAYNVCYDEETRSIASIANLVATHVGDGSTEVVFDIPEGNNAYGYAPTVQMFLNSKKLRTLGWQPTVTMKEAYIRLAEYITQETP